MISTKKVKRNSLEITQEADTSVEDWTKSIFEKKMTKSKEEVSLTFSTGTVVPVGVDIWACRGWNFDVMTILDSFAIIVIRYQHQQERPLLSKNSKKFPGLRIFLW